MDGLAAGIDSVTCRQTRGGAPIAERSARLNSTAGAIGRIWQYSTATDQLKLLAEHNSTFFAPGAANFLTRDEESSGIIDASSVLGSGWFLLNVQAHYSIAGELVEGGQILALYNPDSH